MKKLLLFVAFLLFNFSIKAQNYTFLKLNQPYVELVNATSINEGEIWDDFEFPIQLPFTFTVNGQNFQEVIVNDSFLSFEGVLSEIISPMGNDLIDRGANGENSLSALGYQIAGPIGNRILKIEYKNCGSFDDFSLSMFVNFQIWLYESSNVFEFHYGSNNVMDAETFYSGESGGIIGTTTIDFETDELTNSLFLVGSATNPTTTSEFDFVVGTPPSTTVYRFTPTFLSTITSEKQRYSVYPNPSNNLFFFNGITENMNYLVTDISGKIIQKGLFQVNEASLDLSAYESGLYFLKFESGEVIRLIKK